jgi:hypothetical protein
LKNYHKLARDAALPIEFEISGWHKIWQ